MAKPFSERAARMSCYMALGVYVLGGLSAGSQLLWGLFVVAACIAFGLGIVGIVGGVKRDSMATIRMGLLGAMLSGLPLVGAALVALAARAGG